MTITATDPAGESISASFVWRVDNIPPIVMEPLEPQNFTTSDEVIINIADIVVDGDNDSLTFEATGLPDGLSIDPVTGVISGTPQQEGVFTVRVTVSDGEGGQVQTSVSFDILQTGFVLPDMPLTQDVNFDRASPVAGLESAPIALRDFFAEHSLSNVVFEELERRRERGEYGLDIPVYLGNVMAAKVPGVDHDCGYLLMETVAMDHAINVQLMSPINSFCDVAVTSWDITLANGRSLPSWIERTGNLLNIQSQPGEDNVQLRIRAVMDNGRTVVMNGEIDLGTAQITELGRASASLSSFADQLAAEQTAFAPEHDELVKALA